MPGQDPVQGNSDAGFGLRSYAERQKIREQEEQAKNTSKTIQFHPDGARLVSVFADLETRNQVV